jgi:hypothetical protein
MKDLLTLSSLHAAVFVWGLAGSGKEMCCQIMDSGALV